MLIYNPLVQGQCSPNIPTPSSVHRSAYIALGKGDLVQL